MWSKTEKPAYLTDAEKEKVIGTEAGWVYQHPFGVNEILVAMHGIEIEEEVEPAPEPEPQPEPEPEDGDDE